MNEPEIQTTMTAYGPKTITRIMAELAAPFRFNDLEWRIGHTDKTKKQGKALTYMTSRAVQNRLDEVLGCTHWKNEHIRWGENEVLCTLYLLINGEWIGKADGAEETKYESTKGGLSAAMKRAACLWGIGRYLYALEGFWEPVVPRGDSFVLAGPPPYHRLPKWAVHTDDLVEWHELQKRAGNDRKGTNGSSHTSGTGATTNGQTPGTKNPLGSPTKPGSEPTSAGTAQPSENRDPVVSLTVRSEAAQKQATQGPDAGKTYLLLNASDDQGQVFQVVAFDTASQAVLTQAKVGSLLTGAFKARGQGAKGSMILELLPAHPKAS